MSPAEPGTLWNAVRRRAQQALHSGALVPIATHCEVVEDQGVPFVVRVAPELERKTRAARLDAPADPFLPFDAALHVADLSDTHVALLNKFCVLDHHLLLVTRTFQEQQSPLTRADFAAMCGCLAEIDGLAFYNSGAVAGASQRHKHLQLVTLPLGPTPVPIPMEQTLESARFEARVGVAARLPFRHALGRVAWDARGGVVERFRSTYRELLQALALDPESQPYNLLATRRWMLAVPRRREGYASISVNALGFAGALLVRDRGQLARVKEQGPMHLLRTVAEPLPERS